MDLWAGPETSRNKEIMMIKTPRKIQIEVTNRCNLECAMCPRPKLGLEYKDMDLSVLKRILQKIPSSTEIILTGWGESLLYPDIFTAISLFKNKNCTVKITTNGTLLNYDMAKRLIDSGVDSISISVDSFGAIDKAEARHKCHSIKDNIKSLISVRGGRKKPHIVLQPTLHKGREEDIFELMRDGKELGVDRVNIVRLDRRFNKELIPFSVSEERQIAKKVTVLADSLKLKIDFLPFIAFDGLKRTLFIFFSRVLFSKSMACLKLYDYIYITHTGKVTPCCALPKYEVGDLLSQSLGEIWRNPVFNKFRKNHNLVCEGCNALRLSN